MAAAAVAILMREQEARQDEAPETKPAKPSKSGKHSTVPFVLHSRLQAGHKYDGKRLRVSTLRRRLDKERDLRQGYWKLLVWTSFLLVLYCVVAMQARVTFLYRANTAARTVLDGHANADRFLQISRASDVYNWLRDVFVPQLLADDSALVDTCQHSGEAVPVDKFCDGAIDCADASDEVNCEVRDCNAQFAQCTAPLVSPESDEDTSYSPSFGIGYCDTPVCTGEFLTGWTPPVPFCGKRDDGTSVTLNGCQLQEYSTDNCTGPYVATSIVEFETGSDDNGHILACSTLELPLLPSFDITILDHGVAGAVACTPGGASSPTSLIHHHFFLNQWHFAHRPVYFLCQFGVQGGDLGDEFDCSFSFATAVDREDLSDAQSLSLPSTYELVVTAYAESDGETTVVSSVTETIPATLLRECMYAGDPNLAGCSPTTAQWPLLGDGVCHCEIGGAECAYDMGDCTVDECAKKKKKRTARSGGGGASGEEEGGSVRWSPLRSRVRTVRTGTPEAEHLQQRLSLLKQAGEANATCSDSELWVGADFSVCQDYTVDPTRCTDAQSYWALMAASGHSTPYEACCACGGGAPVESECFTLRSEFLGTVVHVWDTFLQASTTVAPGRDIESEVCIASSGTVFLWTTAPTGAWQLFDQHNRLVVECGQSCFYARLDFQHQAHNFAVRGVGQSELTSEPPRTTSVYVDGQLLSTATDWTRTVLTINPNFRTIALHMTGQAVVDKPASFIAAFEPSGRTEQWTDRLVVTDDQWKCKRSPPAGFNEVGFNDASWGTAQVVLNQAVGRDVDLYSAQFPSLAYHLFAEGTFSGGAMVSPVACRYTNPNPLSVTAQLQVANVSAELNATAVSSLASAFAQVSGLPADSVTVSVSALAGPLPSVVVVGQISDLEDSLHVVGVARAVQSADPSAWQALVAPALGDWAVVEQRAEVTQAGNPDAQDDATPELTCASPLEVSLGGFGMATVVSVQVTAGEGEGEGEGGAVAQRVKISLCNPVLPAVWYTLRNATTSELVARDKYKVEAELVPGAYTLEIASDGAVPSAMVLAECAAHRRVVTATLHLAPGSELETSLPVRNQIGACLAREVPHAWGCERADRVTLLPGALPTFEITTCPALVDDVAAALAALTTLDCVQLELELAEVAVEIGTTPLRERAYTSVLELANEAALSGTANALSRCDAEGCQLYCVGDICEEGRLEGTSCSCVRECTVCRAVVVKIEAGWTPTRMAWKLDHHDPVSAEGLRQYEIWTYTTELCPFAGNHTLTLYDIGGWGWDGLTGITIEDPFGEVLYAPSLPTGAWSELELTFSTDVVDKALANDYLAVSEECSPVWLTSRFQGASVLVLVNDNVQDFTLLPPGRPTPVGVPAELGCHWLTFVIPSTGQNFASFAVDFDDTGELYTLEYEEFDVLSTGGDGSLSLRTAFQVSESSTYFGSRAACFQCDDDAWVHADLVCDGTDHCGNGADEDSCFTCGFDAPATSGPTVLPPRAQCDGEVACADGSDEFYCFRCDDEQSLVRLASPLNPSLPSQRCDGVVDCASGLDEDTCDLLVGRCLPSSMVCDFEPDCLATTGGNATTSEDEGSCGSCGSYYQVKVANHLHVIGYAWLGVSVREFETCPEGAFSEFQDQCVTKGLVTDNSRVLCVGVCKTPNATEADCLERTTTLLPTEEADQSPVCEAHLGRTNLNRWVWFDEGDAFMVPLTDRRMYQAQEAIEWWREAELVDELTGGFKVVLPMYDTTNQLFVIATMQVDIGVEGYMVPSIDTTAVDGEPYDFEDSNDVVRFVLEVLLVVGAVADLLSELFEIAHYVRSPNVSILDYFHDFYNVLDWMFYISFLLSVVFWGRVVSHASRVEIPCGRDTASYIALVGDLAALNDAVAAYQTVLALLMITVMLKTFKYFDFQNRLSVLNRTLAHAITYLGPFMFVMVYVFLGFSMMAHFTFGDKLQEYSHPALSFVALFGLMVTDSYYWVGMLGATKWIGMVVYFAYALLVIITLFNMSVAIVIDAFLNVLNESSDDGNASITAEVAHSLRHLWERVRVLTPLGSSCLDEKRLRQGLDQLPKEGKEFFSGDDLMQALKYNREEANTILDRYGEEDDLARLVKETDEMSLDNRRLAARLALELNDDVDDVKGKLSRRDTSARKNLNTVKAEMTKRLEQLSHNLDALLEANK